MLLMVHELIDRIPSDEAFGRLLGRTPVGKIVGQLADFTTLVQAASELVRGNVPQVTKFGGRLEGISFEAGRLLVETGVVETLDDGIVMFHERITRDKPGLRRILRTSDRRAGRLARVKASKAQKATRTALKAGMVVRRKGKIVRFTPAAKRAIRKAKRADTLKQQKALAKRQRTARARLTKGFA